MLPDLKIGTCIILRWGQLVLMGKRKGSHGAGTWSFPGGHPDPNETVDDAVRRELYEETGLRYTGPLAHATFVENHFEAEGKRYVTLYMEGRVTGFDNKPVLREPNKCEEWRWVNVNDLPQPLFAPIEKLLQSGYRFT